MAHLLTQSTCTRAEILSRRYSTRTVAELVGISLSTLWALKKRHWKPAKWGRPMPTDFAIQAHGATRNSLSLHYKVSNSITDRWRRELAARR